MNGGIGGPIIRDRVWFHGAYRRWGTESYQPTRYFYDNPIGWPSLPVAGSQAAGYGLHGNYDPNAIRDPSTQAYDQNLSWDLNGILTMQVSDNNKVAVAGHPAAPLPLLLRHRLPRTPRRGDHARSRPEPLLAGQVDLHGVEPAAYQAGTSGNKMNWNSGPNPIATDDVISVLDTDTGFRTRSTARYSGRDQALGYNSSTYTPTCLSTTLRVRTVSSLGATTCTAGPLPTGNRTGASTTSSRPALTGYRRLSGDHARDAAEPVEPGNEIALYAADQ